ncbi:MAG: HIT family protein [Ignavibacteriae bacterium]|nr:MAG: HIT family protein [Ignavibacteriota bacterium]
MDNNTNCVFCDINAEHDERRFVYEDDLLFVIPTIEPVNKGHLLIIPKQHAVYFNELDDKTSGHVMQIAKQMAEAIRKSKYKCEGINLFLADGKAAGQEVFHFHLHVYPRFEGDGWGFKWDESKNLIKKKIRDLDEVVEEIKRNFSF